MVDFAVYVPTPSFVSPRTEQRWDKACYSVWCGFGCICAWIWHKACFWKYVRRGVSYRGTLVHISADAGLQVIFYLTWTASRCLLSAFIFMDTDCDRRGAGGDGVGGASVLTANLLSPDCRKKYSEQDCCQHSLSLCVSPCLIAGKDL